MFRISSFAALFFCQLAVLYTAATSCADEEGIAEALKGEDLPKGQYKKLNRDQVTVVAQGDPSKALAYAENYLEKYPNDLECRYLRILAHTKLGNIDRALGLAEEAVSKGMPASRIAAGPRNLLKPLYAHPGYPAFASKHVSDLIHGPTLGAVTDSGAQFWVRIASENEVEVIVRPADAGDGGRGEARAKLKIGAASDFTGVIRVGGLEPLTKYTYSLLIGGKPVPGDHGDNTFSTFPKQGEPAKFEIGFGGGAGYTPWKEHMWTTLRRSDPMAFFLLGDNVYIDTPTCPETQRYCYYRRQSRPEFRSFAAGTPLFAIWDDHDFGDNDCTSSLDPDRPAWKGDVLGVFKENWVNPSYGGGDGGAPGIWFSHQIADVDFFFLDCRFYRQNPKEVKESPSMLGPDQKRWLLKGLEESEATFKVLCSSVPWAPGAKGKSKDTWDGFPEERQEIFDHLAEHEVSGVVLLAADRHRSDAWRIPRENGYTLFEFQSSKLTNVHTHPVLPGSLFGTNQNSFGLVQFDTAAEEPSVTYRIMDIEGKEVHKMAVGLNDLGGAKR